MNKVIGPYQIKEVIGSGQYGKVHKGVNFNTNQVVAIKVISLTKFHEVPKLCEFILNETSSLKKIEHENVISLLDSLQTSNNLYLIYEFCEGGTLEDVIQRKGVLSERESLKLFGQIINAFGVLFKEKILHRDLKPSNILMHEGVLKIADFGFCKPMMNEIDLTQTMVGSPIYMAPEILKGDPYSIQADIWSMGIVLYEMLYGNCPYYEYNLYALLQSITKTKVNFPNNVNQVSDKTKHLILKMLTIEPKKRITWNELCSFFFGDQNTAMNQPSSSNSSNNSKVYNQENIPNHNNAFSKKYSKSNKKTNSSVIDSIREKIFGLTTTLTLIFENYHEEFVYPLIYLILCRLEHENYSLKTELESKKTISEYSKEAISILKHENEQSFTLCKSIAEELNKVQNNPLTIEPMRDDFIFIKACFDFIHRILEQAKSIKDQKKWLILSNSVSDVAIATKNNFKQGVSISNIQSEYIDVTTSKLIECLNSKTEKIKLIIN